MNLSNPLVPTRHAIAIQVRPLTSLLVKKFEQHIGAKNAITKQDLFSYLFKTDLRYDSLKDWVRWEFVKKSLHHLRQRTHCFVVSKFEGGTWLYYVPESDDDLTFYLKNLDNTVKKIRWMQERAKHSIEQRWFTETWTLENGNRKLPKQ